MAGVERRFAEAQAALVTLDEAVTNASRSLVERDSAILRLIYTFEAVWKACQQLLGEREDTEVASPNTAIRAAARLALGRRCTGRHANWAGSQSGGPHVSWEDWRGNRRPPRRTCRRASALACGVAAARSGRRLRPYPKL